jgi:molecular chaperone HtpG
LQNILKEDKTEKQVNKVRNLVDLALLSQGLLKGADLTNFINRSVDLLQGEKQGRIILST